MEGTARNGLYRTLGVTGGMPITVFCDAEGMLVETIFAPFDDAQLMDQLSTLGFVS